MKKYHKYIFNNINIYLIITNIYKFIMEDIKLFVKLVNKYKILRKFKIKIYLYIFSNEQIFKVSKLNDIIKYKKLDKNYEIILYNFYNSIKYRNYNILKYLINKFDYFLEKNKCIILYWTCAYANVNIFKYLLKTNIINETETIINFNHVWTSALYNNFELIKYFHKNYITTNKLDKHFYINDVKLDIESFDKKYIQDFFSNFPNIKFLEINYNKTDMKKIVDWFYIKKGFSKKPVNSWYYGSYTVYTRKYLICDIIYLASYMGFIKIVNYLRSTKFAITFDCNIFNYGFMNLNYEIIDYILKCKKYCGNQLVLISKYCDKFYNKLLKKDYKFFEYLKINNFFNKTHIKHIKGYEIENTLFMLNLCYKCKNKKIVDYIFRELDEPIQLVIENKGIFFEIAKYMSDIFNTYDYFEFKIYIIDKLVNKAKKIKKDNYEISVMLYKFIILIDDEKIIEYILKNELIQIKVLREQINEKINEKILYANSSHSYFKIINIIINLLGDEKYNKIEFILKKFQKMIVPFIKTQLKAKLNLYLPNIKDPKKDNKIRKILQQIKK